MSLGTVSAQILQAAQQASKSETGIWRIEAEVTRLGRKGSKAKPWYMVEAFYVNNCPSDSAAWVRAISIINPTSDKQLRIRITSCEAVSQTEI